MKKASHVRMTQRTRQMQSDVRQFGETSARQLDERLERLWRHKQREKEERYELEIENSSKVFFAKFGEIHKKYGS